MNIIEVGQRWSRGAEAVVVSACQYDPRYAAARARQFIELAGEALGGPDFGMWQTVERNICVYLLTAEHYIREGCADRVDDALCAEWLALVAQFAKRRNAERERAP